MKSKRLVTYLLLFILLYSTIPFPILSAQVITGANFASENATINLDATTGTLTISKWNGNSWYKISAGATPIKTTEITKGVFEQQYLNFKTRIYEINDGIEYEIEIASPPKSNIFNFPITSKNVRFTYQPPLTSEFTAGFIAEFNEICTVTATQVIGTKSGKIYVDRPENVVDSYSVYSLVPNGQYGSGKIGHIYRPKAIASDGSWTWGTLAINNGVMSVEIDSQWLKDAIYPVIIDPTFGDTTTSSTATTVPALSIIVIKATPLTSGYITSMSVYGQDAGSTGYIRAVLYDSTGLEVPNGPSSGAIFPTGPVGWKTVSYLIAPPQITAYSQYWIGVATDSSSGVRFRYDAGTTDYMIVTPITSFEYPPANIGSVATGQRDYSIYATYSDKITNVASSVVTTVSYSTQSSTVSKDTSTASNTIFAGTTTVTCTTTTFTSLVSTTTTSTYSFLTTSVLTSLTSSPGIIRTGTQSTTATFYTVTLTTATWSQTIPFSTTIVYTKTFTNPVLTTTTGRSFTRTNLYTSYGKTTIQLSPSTAYGGIKYVMTSVSQSIKYTESGLETVIVTIPAAGTLTGFETTTTITTSCTTQVTVTSVAPVTTLTTTTTCSTDTSENIISTTSCTSISSIITSITTTSTSESTITTVTGGALATRIPVAITVAYGTSVTGSLQDIQTKDGIYYIAQQANQTQPNLVIEYEIANVPNFYNMIVNMYGNYVTPATPNINFEYYDVHYGVWEDFQLTPLLPLPSSGVDGWFNSTMQDWVSQSGHALFPNGTVKFRLIRDSVWEANVTMNIDYIEVVFNYLAASTSTTCETNCYTLATTTTTASTTEVTTTTLTGGGQNIKLPSSITVVAGYYSVGSLSSVYTIDSDYYVVVEDVGPEPNLDVPIVFSNIPQFYNMSINMYGRKVGGIGDTIYLEYYDVYYNTWEILGNLTVPTSDGWNNATMLDWLSQSGHVLSPSDSMQIRYHHHGDGFSNCTLYIDYLEVKYNILGATTTTACATACYTLGTTTTTASTTESTITTITAGAYRVQFPDSVTMVAGSYVEGAVSSVLTVDGDFYAVAEVTGDEPNLDIRFHLNNVPSFYNMVFNIYAKKVGGVGDPVSLQYYDVHYGTWETLGNITVSDVLGWYNCTMLNWVSQSGHALFPNGTIMLRYYHYGTGHDDCTLYVDYLEVGYNYMGASTTTTCETYCESTSRTITSTSSSTLCTTGSFTDTIETRFTDTTTILLTSLETSTYTISFSTSTSETYLVSTSTMCSTSTSISSDFFTTTLTTVSVNVFTESATDMSGVMMLVALVVAIAIIIKVSDGFGNI